jgi:integral membrane sensor domain MASE1
LELAVNTFSLATVMIAVVGVAVLLAMSRLGYWPCIAAWTILGSLVLSIIPTMINGTPRPVFVMIGAVGGVCGCWLGSRMYSYSGSFEQQTEFITMIEYERLYALHRRIFIVTMLCSGLVGGIIGLGMCNLVARTPFGR